MGYRKKAIGYDLGQKCGLNGVGGNDGAMEWTGGS